MRWKVCVYAICKNEIKYVDAWVKSMSEADWICVLDTGSTDGTIERLRELGCRVEEKAIDPWRFDVARNESMKLIPEEADVCVCTDMDELMEPGWRASIEKHWKPDAIQARYRYTWNFNADGTEGTVFLYDKIHVNHDFKWIHPVHEVLHYDGDAPHAFVMLPGIQLNHHADTTKSRSNYLPLLEMAVEEDPENDRNLHYLGREYMFYRRWDDSINTLKKHLTCPKSTWREERCASMRFIGRCYESSGQANNAMEYYWKGIAECPYLREPYVEMAKMLYRQEDWFGVLFLVDKILKIRTRTGSYICEADAWGALPYDIASMAFFHIGNIPMALNMARGARDKAPSDQRVAKNIELFEQLLKKQEEIGEQVANAGVPSVQAPEKRVNAPLANEYLEKMGIKDELEARKLDYENYMKPEQSVGSAPPVAVDRPAADMNAKAKFQPLAQNKTVASRKPDTAMPELASPPRETLNDDTQAALDAAMNVRELVDAMFT